MHTTTKDLQGELLTDDARHIAKVRGSYRISGGGRQGPDPGYFSYAGEFELMSGGRLVEAGQDCMLNIRWSPHLLRITILDIRGPYNEGLYRADFATRDAAAR